MQIRDLSIIRPLLDDDDDVDDGNVDDGDDVDDGDGDDGDDVGEDNDGGDDDSDYLNANTGSVGNPSTSGARQD